MTIKTTISSIKQIQIVPRMYENGLYSLVLSNFKAKTSAINENTK